MSYKDYLSYAEWMNTTGGLINECGRMIDPGYKAPTGYGLHLAFTCSICKKDYSTPWHFYGHCLSKHGVIPRWIDRGIS